MKLIVIALREFALPAPRTGSIEAHSGYGPSAAEGREIHLRVQKGRGKSDPLYQAEVPISGTFTRGDYQFRVDGRIDGIFRHDPPKIEEIKSGFNTGELSRRLRDNPLSHPYGLQLLTYGYLYWLENKILPYLSFHLVSSRTGQSQHLPLQLDLPLYEQWLGLRLDELAVEAGLAEKRAARRRKVAASLAFPFEKPRSGQMELMQTVQEWLGEGKPMLIQAPTGLGKTVGVLYPVLKEALARGQRVVYTTPKNSQHLVAEDAIARFRDAGSNVKSLTITAKTKICPKPEPLCTPEYCEYARDYYRKMREHDIQEILSRKRRLKARIFREIGERYQVCPFELQVEAVREADVVICDYNYVFAPSSALSRVSEIGIDRTGKANLVIDEAHNLPTRAMDYYSPGLSTATLERMRERIRELPQRFRRKAEELLNACLGAVASFHRFGPGPFRISPPAEVFFELDGKIKAFLSHYLDSDLEVKRDDPVIRLSFYWSEFTEALKLAADPDREEFFTTWHPHPSGGIVKITCCDASLLLKDCYAGYGRTIGFSATLKPFAYYARLSGLDPERVRTAEFTSPFPRELRKLLIIPQVSTRYAHRERNYGKITDAVRRISAVRPGNYLVFLPSFDFLERVSELLQPTEGFVVLKQERGMGAAEVEAILDALRAGTAATIVLAVQGGSFSEGIDYAGEMVMGAFVIGPPLPTFDLEREEMREYYQRKYGAGFEYAYTIPAMAKAVQAAGRVIRSERDQGLIVLMDGRFMEPHYCHSMPVDWFDSHVTELVSGSILREVADFWQSSEGRVASEGKSP